MKLYDEYEQREITMQELFRDWKTFSQDEPWNHADSFRTEMYEILMATINGRNDCEIIGLTPAETSRYIMRIRSAIN